MSRPSDRPGSGPGRGDGEGFLGRWSERKLKARTLPDDADQAGAGDVAREDLAARGGLPAAAAGDAETPPKTEAEILAELGLPDPDTLAKGDDFAGFMKAAVPAALRNRALRRLWLTDPVLANVDGLNDYDGDFTDAATGVKGVLKTAYKVGRGFLRDEPDAGAEAADADARTGAATEGNATDEGGDDVGTAGPSDQSAPSGGLAAAGTAGAPPPQDPGSAADAAARPGARAGAERPEADPPPARRMRFSFDG